MITISSKALRQAMNLLDGVVAKKNTTPILSNIALKQKGAFLYLSVTDLDMWAKTNIPIIEGDEQEIVTTVSYKELKSIAKVSGDVDFILSSSPENNILHIRDADEFVKYELASVEYEDILSGPINKDPLLKAHYGNGSFVEFIGSVKDVASTEPTRYYLNGVHWKKSGAGEFFEATDGHRAFRRMVTREEPPKEEHGSHIIPNKSVAVICKRMKGRDVSVFWNDGIMRVASEHMIITTKLIDGTFPDVDRVIPKRKNMTHVVYGKQAEFASAIARVGAIKADYKYGRAIAFKQGEEYLTLTTRLAGFGSSVVKTQLKSKRTKKMEEPTELPKFGVSDIYIQSIIDKCASGEVALFVEHPGAPILIDDTDKDMTRVLMPMRI